MRLSPFKGEDRRGMGYFFLGRPSALPHPHPCPPLEGEGIYATAKTKPDIAAFFGIITFSAIIGYAVLLERLNPFFSLSTVPGRCLLRNIRTAR